MVDLTPEQKKALEEQKAQCPFCQIISGKILAEKIYEDGKVIAILDINPAREGHVLFMTKEHYPILPLIPESEQEYMFRRLKDLIEKVKKGVLLADSANFFIANGGAAGQQSPHFMIHVIPRDKNDKLKSFNIEKNPIDPEKTKKLSEFLRSNLQKMMGERFDKHKMIIDEKTSPEKTVIIDNITEKEIFELLEDNPVLKKMIRDNIEEAKKIIDNNEKLKVIFKGFDIENISFKIKKEELMKKPKVGGETPNIEDNENNEKKRNHEGKIDSKEKNNKTKDDDKADLDLISRLF